MKNPIIWLGILTLSSQLSSFFYFPSLVPNPIPSFSLNFIRSLPIPLSLNLMAEHPNLNQDHNAPFVTQNFLLQMHVFSFNGISSAMTGTKARYRPLQLNLQLKRSPTNLEQIPPHQ